VQIEPTLLRVANRLAEPTERLLEYTTTTEARADADQQAGFVTRAQLQIKVRTAPIWYSVARRRALNSARTSLARQETTLRAVVARHRNRPFILPQF
jgi:hypothetical protein